MLTHLTGQSAPLFLWWLAIILLSGVMATKFIGLCQRILVRVYSVQKGSPRWHVTMTHATGWVSVVLVWVVIVAVIASRLGMPPALIAGLGTVLGAAIGFGSQEIVRDVVKGAVHLMERQFAVGDVVSLTVSGQDNIGVVEAVSLRSVVISTENDGRVNVPQGFISVVKNYSIGKGRFVVDLPFDTDVSIQKVLSVLREVAAAVAENDPVVHDWVPESDHEALASIISARVRGVSRVDTGAVVMQVEGVTSPGEQFAARRALLRCFSYRLDDEGIRFKSSEVSLTR